MSEWPTLPLGQLIRIASGQVDPKTEPYSGMTHVGPENILEGGGVLVPPLTSAKELELVSGKYEFDEDAILYSKIRPNLNKVVMPRFRGICSADIYPLWPRDDSIDTDFLYELIRSPIVLRPAVAASGRTGLPKINRPDLEAIAVPVPPLSEQRCIARKLSTWGEMLERLSRQIEHKERLLESIRERLIHGAHRLGDRNAPWPMVALSEVTRQLTGRNGDRYGRDLVMGVTKAEGIVPMREHVVAENISRYLVLPPNGFAYNPMRINIGSIAMSEHEGDVIVSPDYVVFACKEDRLHPRFLNHLRRTKAWADFMTIAGNGSVRVRIYYASLAEFEFHLPPLDEQCAIVEVLDDAEREITALEAERAALARQRDALATELLTGRLRVPQAEAAS